MNCVSTQFVEINTVGTVRELQMQELSLICGFD